MDRLLLIRESAHFAEFGARVPNAGQTITCSHCNRVCSKRYFFTHIKFVHPELRGGKGMGLSNKIHAVAHKLGNNNRHRTRQ